MISLFSNKSNISTVSTFSELVTTHFQGETNAICWERNLTGDFKEISSKLTLKDNITIIEIKELNAIELSENGELARNIILKDLQSLTEIGASPVLNLIKNYERDHEFDFISTDVYSFHVDRSPIETDTYLCTYHGASSDIIANDEAIQKILIPEIREELRKLHQGTESEFEDFLQEYYFDLHYEAKINAVITNLGKGHLWKLAVNHPNQKNLPCIHRAPKENDGELRLLLIC